MRRLFVAAGVLAVTAWGAVSAAAATLDIVPGGTTSVEVTADLDGLGLSAGTIGTATAEVVDGNLVVDFPITGGSVTDGVAMIEHEGSGVEIFLTSDPSSSISLTNFLIDTGEGSVSSDVNGIANAVVFDFGTIDDSGIPLNFAGFLAGALTAAFGAPNTTGGEFGIANTNPEIAPIPLPAGAPLLIAGLAAFAFLRRRKVA